VDNKEKYIEWYFQSDYDLDTAFDMLNSGRNIYCIFMCHLSLEKALKGLYVKNTGKFPTKTHSLIYLKEKIDLKMNDIDYEFIYILNKISVPTRYPEDLQKLFSLYPKDKTEDIYNKTKALQGWIKIQ
jgi:HEPN domain-containing protein